MRGNPQKDETMRRYNPDCYKNLKGMHPGRPKGSKSVLTVTDLWDAIHKLEESVKQATGKDFNYVNDVILKGSLKSERLQLAIFDRLCPIQRQPVQVEGEISHKLNVDLSQYGITDEYIEQYASDLLARRHPPVNAATN
ncbi:MAG: hypothetical protein QME51_10455 [Planctomycetota bacterium]|nr:hypothetical protein [Planctomycetota bacterium]